MKSHQPLTGRSASLDARVFRASRLTWVTVALSACFVSRSMAQNVYNDSGGDFGVQHFIYSGSACGTGNEVSSNCVVVGSTPCSGSLGSDHLEKAAIRCVVCANNVIANLYCQGTCIEFQCGGEWIYARQSNNEVWINKV